MQKKHVSVKVAYIRVAFWHNRPSTREERSHNCQTVTPIKCPQAIHQIPTDDVGDVCLVSQFHQVNKLNTNKAVN